MASNCYNIFMPTPCHDEYGDVEIGTYLDTNGFNHDGWSESECRNYATTHYNGKYCTEKSPSVLFKKNSKCARLREKEFRLQGAPSTYLQSRPSVQLWEHW